MRDLVELFWTEKMNVGNCARWEYLEEAMEIGLWIYKGTKK